MGGSLVAVGCCGSDRRVASHRLLGRPGVRLNAGCIHAEPAGKRGPALAQPGHTRRADASWRPHGPDVPQLYLTEATGDKRMRLLGFERVELHPANHDM
jgi:hypothetical protein